MSQPNWKGPFGLALALVVLASGAYWSEFTRKPKKEEADEQEKKILILKDKQIRSIYLSQRFEMGTRRSTESQRRRRQHQCVFIRAQQYEFKRYD
jgi:hypothetical protein